MTLFPGRRRERLYWRTIKPWFEARRNTKGLVGNSPQGKGTPRAPSNKSQPLRRELIDAHGQGRRYQAIESARLTRDGKQVKAGNDDQFWWRVVLEIDKLQGTVRLDAGTRYEEDRRR
jgi:hypothetical protein